MHLRYFPSPSLSITLSLSPSHTHLDSADNWEILLGMWHGIGIWIKRAAIAEMLPNELQIELHGRMSPA